LLRPRLYFLLSSPPGLALTSGALAWLHAVDRGSGRASEVFVLLTAGLAATLLRFGLYRSWVFRGGAA
jgi:hypothetical protein